MANALLTQLAKQSQIPIAETFQLLKKSISLTQLSTPQSLSNEASLLSALLQLDITPKHAQDHFSTQTGSTSDQSVKTPHQQVDAKPPHDTTKSNQPKLTLAEQLLHLKDQGSKESNIPKASHKILEEPLYIQEAGLVLTWSFLTTYFSRIGLLTDNTFTNVAESIQGVHLLHFLASGHTSAPEHELTMSKLLCGIDLDTPIPTEVDLGKEALAHGEDLLKAMMKYWPPMEQSSPDGLRGSFLMREGRLTETAETWELQIEQKPYDLLLAKASFSYSIVKLPWMSKVLYVQWT